MFIRLSPAQATGIHGWGSRLKTTLTWRDVEENEDVDLDLMLKWQVSPKELCRMQPDVMKWVLHAGAKARHAKELADIGAHPIHQLHGDLGDVLALKATSKQLKAMGVTYKDLKTVGMTPETMRMLGLSLQGWIDLDISLQDTREHFTDAQLGRVFLMTRAGVSSCFK